jgi:short-subunit dehydrogenase
VTKMKHFEGQIAVVTGASSGIGRAIALGLAAEGCSLCLVGRNQQRLRDVAEAAGHSGSRVLIYNFDLGVDEEIAKLKEALQRDCERVDVLVHSAGIIFSGPVASAPLAEFDQQYRTNVRAPFAVTQALLPMLRIRRGQIVFINSSVGVATRANISQYSATKHALKAVADCLREEVNPEGIRVLSVYPGRTATPQQVMIYRAEGKEYHPELLMQPEDVASVVINALRLEQTAEVMNIHIRPMKKS